MLVQDMGVGIMMFGVGDVLIEGVPAAVEQADIMKSKTSNTEKILIEFPNWRTIRHYLLFNCLLQFFEGRHPRDGVDEVFQ